MEERFERFKKIAREEFECEIERNEKTSNFKEVFGFNVEAMREEEGKEK